MFVVPNVTTGKFVGYFQRRYQGFSVKNGAKVLVNCSNRILTEAICRILSKKSEFDVFSPEVPAKETADTARSEADVLVFDTLDAFTKPMTVGNSANSIEKASCVLVAMEDNHLHFLKAIKSGVRGYVLRDASTVEVISAIRSVAQGQAACPSAYTGILFDYVATASRQSSTTEVCAWGLTRREQEIVPLIGRGLTNKEIAQVLNLSEQTIKNHIHRMMRKLQSNSRLDACNTWLRQSGSGFPAFSVTQDPA